MKTIKKPLCLALLISGMVLSVFCSCAKKPGGTKKPDGPGISDGESEVIFLDKILHANIRGTAFENFPKRPEDDADNGVQIAYLYKGKRPEIAFLRSDNPRADAISKGLVQLEELDEPYQNYRHSWVEWEMDYSLLEPGETVAVNSITVSVNGKEVVLDTKDRLILSRYSVEDEEERRTDAMKQAVQVYYGGASVKTSGHMPITAEIIYTVKRDAVVEKLELADWLRIADATVYVDDDNRGKLRDVLPLSLYEGQMLQIELVAEAQQECHPFSEFLTELRLYYSEKDTEERMLPLLFECSLEKNNLYKRLIHYMTADSLGSAENMTFLEDYTCYNRQYNNRGNVELFFLYPDDTVQPYIRLKDMESETVSAALTDYWDSFCTGYRGYRLCSVTFQFDLSGLEPGEAPDPGKVTLLVGDTEKTVDLTGKILPEPWQEEVPDPASFNNFGGATYFSEGEKRKEMELAGVSRVNEPVTLQKVEVSGPMAFSEIKAVVNGTETGTVERVFPLELKAGDDFHIIGTPDYGDLDPFAQIRGIGVMLYYTDAAGKEQVLQTESQILMFCLSGKTEEESRERYETFMKHLLKKLGK